MNETPKRAKRWTFNYWDAKAMNNGRQMRNLWELPVTPRSERVNGAHPSQKPLALVERAVQLCSLPGELLLDPFGGAGTLAVAAQRHGRRWVLVESVEKYAELARQRLAADQPPTSLSSKNP